jgi:hypothetical protein
MIKTDNFRGFWFSFIIALIIPLVSVPVGFLLALSYFKDMPPPRLSSNISFDSKARWLRDALSDHHCDVLVLGSSMALNSFHHPSFARRNSDKVVNLGVWGMSIGDGYRMLRAVTSLCRPRLLIMPLYYGDFFASDAPIDWPEAEKYIGGGNSLVTYLKTMDLISLVKGAKQTSDRRQQGRAIYNTLEFDASGTANLSFENFQVLESRWEGYKSKPVLPASQKSLDALQQIVMLAKSQGIEVMTPTVPMRGAAEQFLDAAVLDGLWFSVEKAVAAGGGRFIRINNDQRFPDEFFADFSHLNERGAAFWTSIIIEKSLDLMVQIHGSPKV